MHRGEHARSTAQPACLSLSKCIPDMQGFPQRRPDPKRFEHVDLMPEEQVLHQQHSGTGSMGQLRARQVPALHKSSWKLDTE